MKNILIFLSISFLVIFLNSFPNYYAYLQTPKDMIFSGQASWFDPWDINLYVSVINWGQNHGILLSNTYTTVENKPILFYPFYTITGSIFKNISPFFLFHIEAILVGFILMLFLWYIIKIFIVSTKTQFIALFLITLGGGMGWLFFPNILSSDLYMTGFTYLSHFQRPHETFGIIFYLLSLVSFYLAVNKSSYLINFVSLISITLQIFFYPFYLLSYSLICGAYSFYLLFYKNTTAFKMLFINLFFAGMSLVFYYQHLQSNPQFSGILNQNLTQQNFIQLIFGWGILLPFTLMQLKNPKKDKKFYFLNFWFFISVSLSFLPFGFARFYLRTLFFPIIILIILNINYLSKLIHLNQKIVLILLIILVPISSFFISYKRLDEISKNNPWFYITQDESQALKFLNTYAQNKGILSGYNMGNIIPAKTNSRSYFGHLLQTPSHQEKINNLIRFYTNIFSEDEAIKFLKENNINYIIWGKEEQELLKNSNNSAKNFGYKFLTPVFAQPSIIIYHF